MKLFLTVALLTMATTTSFAADAKKAPAKPDEAIKQTATGFFDAWNQHDAKAMTSFWTGDATLINPFGRTAHGSAEIETLLNDEQTSVFKASTANVVDMKVTRALGPSTAFCDAEMTVDGAQAPDGSALPQMKYHIALLFEKKAGHWKMAEARPYAFLQPPPEAAKTN